MTDAIKCGACGTSLLPGAAECAVCKTAAVTPVSIKSGGVVARIAAGIFDLLLMCALVAAFSAIGVGWWLVLVAWGITIEIGYRINRSLSNSLTSASVSSPQ
jgi:hypothetical protein